MPHRLTLKEVLALVATMRSCGWAVITIHPQPATAIRDQGASFSVAADGTPPFGYQWRFNGANISGATNNVLTLSNIQSNQAGAYSVLVFNTAGGVLSSNAALTVLIPATITQAPTNRTQTVTFNLNGMFHNPTNVTMSVGAIGTGLLRYQWRFNGQDLAGGTNSSLVITNVTPADEGPYTVVVTDDIGQAISPPALLTVLVPPVILQPPLPQTVFQGGNATFTCIATGAPAPYFRWLSNGVPFTTNFTGVLALTNVSRSFNVRVAVVNSSASANSPSAALTVLNDFDHDGAPDLWEIQFGFSTNNAADALLDFDGDGMINRDEYIAGTNPTDPLSLLKLTVTTTNTSVLEFVAQSNIAYTVQYRTNLAFASWSNVMLIGAQSQVRTTQVSAPNLPAAWEHYYRVMTPPAP